MSGKTIDILMITYSRPAYTRKSLTRLLETCDETMRVWLWHNGTHAETLEVVHSLKDHPRVHRFHHSVENKKLREPTNWLYRESDAPYVAKVDDDCLMTPGWGQKLREAHEAEPRFGAIGCWLFLPEDYIPELAERKIATFGGGHQLLQNLWVGGSGYVMKQACIEREGVIRPKESFTHYCIRLARRGWVNGWYYPFIWQEHMDDPRVPNTGIKSDADIAGSFALSARRRGATSLEAWTAQQGITARIVQEAPLDPGYYMGWRALLRRGWSRVRNRLNGASGAPA